MLQVNLKLVWGNTYMKSLLKKWGQFSLVKQIIIGLIIGIILAVTVPEQAKALLF